MALATKSTRKLETTVSRILREVLSLRRDFARLLPEERIGEYKNATFLKRAITAARKEFPPRRFA